MPDSGALPITINFTAVAPPLNGTRAKLERAKEQLAMLPGAIEEARDVWHDAYLAVRLPNDDVKIKYAIPMPPRLLPLLIGETVHNIRSGLDLMVYDLAIAGKKAAGHDTEQSPVKDSQFPVEHDPQWFEGRISGEVPGKGSRKRNVKKYLEWVEAAYVEMIRQRQPLNGCKWTEMLNEISNQDKHRFMSDLRVEAEIDFPIPEKPGEQTKPNFPVFDFRLHPWLIPIRDALGEIHAGATELFTEVERTFSS